jgi:hypothetical protein
MIFVENPDHMANGALGAFVPDQRVEENMLQLPNPLIHEISACWIVNT